MIVRSTPWQRFRRQPTAMVSLVVLVTMTAACLLSLGWSRTAMRTADLSAARQGPTWAEPLGTDELGRSMLARSLYGGALSLTLGILSAAIAIVLGTVYGLVAGYYGGRLDGALMRLVDLLYALPSLLLVMLLTVGLAPRLEALPGLGKEAARLIVLALAIGGVSWLSVARVVRGQVLSLREQAFVEAARALGVGTLGIFWRHLLPSIIGPVIVFATLTVPQAILQESFLSFLGVGVQAPQATWGSLAADGVRVLSPHGFDWWLLVFPGVLLSVTLLSLNFIGDGVRDALHGRQR